jgi:hypothetical protein
MVLVEPRHDAATALTCAPDISALRPIVRCNALTGNGRVLLQSEKAFTAPCYSSPRFASSRSYLSMAVGANGSSIRVKGFQRERAGLSKEPP